MSSSNRPLPNELRALEAMLTGLEPRSDRLNPEQLWYEAGRRSAMQAAPVVICRWSTAAASGLSASVAAAATLLVMLWTQPFVRTVERVQLVRIPAEQAADPRRAAEGDHPAARQPPLERASENSSRLVSADADGEPRARSEITSLLRRHGLEPWDSHSARILGAGRQPIAGGRDASGPIVPPTHYQQRKDLLGDQARRSQQAAEFFVQRLLQSPLPRRAVNSGGEGQGEEPPFSDRG